MENVNVRIKKTHKNVELPEYKTEGSSGMDIKAFISENTILKPKEIKLIDTGLYLEIPFGYEAQIRSRSGLSLKHGIIVLNSPGTIDSDYRGELKIILMNVSDQEFVIEKNMRIAQMIISRVCKANVELVENVNGTSRGSGGFGHTGIN